MNKDDSDLEKLDRVFPHLHESGEFSLSPCIPRDIEFVYSSGLSHPSVERISELLTKYGYADVRYESYTSYFARLTPKGCAAKVAGGHFAYKKKVAAKEKIEEDISKYDLLKKKFIYKARYVPYIFSTLALIGTAISVFIAYKELHKSDPQLIKPTELTQPTTKKETLPPIHTTLKKQDTL